MRHRNTLSQTGMKQVFGALLLSMFLLAFSFHATAQAPLLSGSPTTANCTSLRVGFTSQVSITVAQYRWDFGDGDTAITAGGNLYHTYTRPGLYTVSLTIVESGTLQEYTTTNTDYIFIEGPVITTNTVIDASCLGHADGTIDITVAGGTVPYSYTWTQSINTISATEDITNVEPATYRVQVADDQNCVVSKNIIVGADIEVVSDIDTSGAICRTAIDGKAWVASVSGGTGPYTYAWSNGSTIDTAYNLPIGSTALTVTDVNGCKDLNYGQVTVLPEYPLSVSKTDVSCYGNSDGKAWVNVDTAAPAAWYTFTWAAGTPTNGIADTVVGLPVGIYTVTVTDFNGCNFLDSVVIGQPDTLLVDTLVMLGPTCSGCADGYLEVEASGGTAPYTYLWSNNFTSKAIANATVGAYLVTVTDANGCTGSLSLSLTSRIPLNIDYTTSGNTANCGPFTVQFNPQTSGQIDSYLWDFGDGQTSTDSTPVHIYFNPGVYTVSLDVVEKFTLLPYNVTKPSLISVGGVSITQGTLGITKVTCYGGSDGAIDISVFGGTSTYNFAWYQKDPSTGLYNTLVGNTEDLSGVPAGAYKVLVSDLNGCYNEAFYNVGSYATAPTELVLGVQHESCSPGGDGKVWIESLIGGSAPYAFSWSIGPPMSFNDTISGLTEGYYDLTVTDANNCTVQAGVTVHRAFSNDPVDIDHTDVLCNGDATGKAWVVDAATNYPFPHTILWSNGQVGDTMHNISAGNYGVTVNETATNCVALADITIDEPNVLEPDLLYTNNPICFLPIVPCFGGFIGVNTYGGTEPYSYSWTRNGSGYATSESLLDALDGNYRLSVTDANGCSAVLYDTLYIASAPYSFGFVGGPRSSICEPLTADFHVPDPGGIGNSYWFVFSDGDTAYGSDVTHTFTQPGTYDVTLHAVLDPGVRRDTTIYGMIQILEPSIAIVDSGHVSCYNGSDGFIDTDVLNVTNAYSVIWYLWNTSNNTPIRVVSNSEDLIGAYAGDYKIVITDTTGCSFEQIYTITQPAPLSLVTDSVGLYCNGGSDGMVWATASGGTQPYNYIWSNGGIGDTIRNLTAGTYRVTVVDANGCNVLGSALILEPTPLVVIMDSIDETCLPGGDGVAWATVTGGTPGYTYAWSGGGLGGVTGDTLLGLVAGPYFITITDTNGCDITDSITINTSSAIVATINSTDSVSCYGGMDGSVNVSITGGTAPYDYFLVGSSISGTASNSNPFDITGLATGGYMLEITDANGCFNNFNFVILEPSPLTLVMDKVDESCSPGGDAKVWGTVNGGVAPYVFIWSGGTPSVGGDTLLNLTQGVYHLSVTDANGCEVSDSITVNGTPSVVTMPLASEDITCYGAGGGKAWIPNIASISTFPLDYLWSDGSTSDTLRAASGGTYSVTVSDPNSSCSVTGSVIINEPDSLYLVFDQVVDATCSTCDDGIIEVTPNGGGAPYTFVWNGNFPTVPFDTSEDHTDLLPGTYFVTMTDANACTVLDFDIIGFGHQCQPTLDLGNDTTLCFPFFNLDHNLPVGTISTHLWSTGETTPSININTTGTYHLYTTDTFGCADHDSITVSFVTPAVTNAGGDTLICDGGSAYLAATGGTSYSWAPAAGLSSTTVATPVASPTDAVTYTVTIADANGCITTHNVLVDVDSTCVWPGDANFDGIANNDDVLSIGLVYGQNGLVRPNASLVWEGQPVQSDVTGFPNWDINKHADCNGDGTIDNLDTNAITLNYGLTHLKWDEAGRMFIDPSLYFVLPDSVAAGQVAEIPIMLGRSALPVDSAYGIIFSINYDNTIVADSPVVLNTTGSWLGTSGADLLAYKHNLYQSSRTDYALTRINGISRAGFGQIGVVSMTMKDDISGKTYLAVDMDLSFSNVKLIDARGNVIPIASEDGVLRVYDPTTSTESLQLLASELRMYPNPSTGVLNIALPGQIMEAVKIVNMLGAEVFSMEASNEQLQMDLNQLDAGTYFLQVEVKGAWLTRKLIITK